ncbi:MAG TPA: hypothetical protein VHE55_08810 [Fimbriimonadaceae bacterium]|nr:hypothetical protein [Fimbriimonadaceae bacterium]
MKRLLTPFLLAILGALLGGCAGSTASQAFVLNVTLLPDSGRTKDVTFGPSANFQGPSNGTPNASSPTQDVSLIPQQAATVYVTGWDDIVTNGTAHPIWTTPVQCPGGHDVTTTIDMSHLP